MYQLSIGKLAKAAKVSIYTIRFYEKSGLLPPPARRPSGFRHYSDQDVLQLRFVREARSLGFSIEEIAELLALEGEHRSATAQAIIVRKLQSIHRSIARLQQWQIALNGLDEHASPIDDCGPSDDFRRSFLLKFLETQQARGADGRCPQQPAVEPV